MQHDTPTPLRAVVFDYAGVLGTSPFDGVRGWEREMGYPDGSAVRLLMQGGYRDPESGHGFHRVEVGEITLRVFLEGLVNGSEESLGGRRFEPDAYLAFLDEPRFGAHWPIVHRARDLRAAGYKVGLLTNNIPEWEGIWTTTIPLEWFDVVVDSCVVGMRKPGAEVYELTCARLGVEPAQAVFLDDMLENVEGARAVGMTGIHVRDVPGALAELDALLAARGAPA